MYHEYGDMPLALGTLNFFTRGSSIRCRVMAFSYGAHWTHHTPLDEQWVRRKDNGQHSQQHMPPTVPISGRPQTHALEPAASEIVPCLI